MIDDEVALLDVLDTAGQEEYRQVVHLVNGDGVPMAIPNISLPKAICQQSGEQQVSCMAWPTRWCECVKVKVKRCELFRSHCL